MIPGQALPNRAASRYARKRFGQAQRLGLTQGALPDDPAAWWRQFSQNPQAWDMGQQLQTQKNVGRVAGAMPGQQPGLQDLLRGGVVPGMQQPGALQGVGNAGFQMPDMPTPDMPYGQVGQGGGASDVMMPDMPNMRQDLIGQLIAAQAAMNPGDPMDELAQRYRSLGSRLGTMRPRKAINRAAKRIQGVDNASNKARQLAVIMAKRLRGA